MINKSSCLELHVNVCLRKRSEAHTHVGVNAPGRPITITDFSAVYLPRSIFSGGNPLCISTEGSYSDYGVSAVSSSEFMLHNLCTECHSI